MKLLEVVAEVRVVVVEPVCEEEVASVEVTEEVAVSAEDMEKTWVSEAASIKKDSAVVTEEPGALEAELEEVEKMDSLLEVKGASTTYNLKLI